MANISTGLPFYRPLCRWCRDEGCIMCDGQRAAMQAQRAKMEIAAEYARERNMQVNQALLEIIADAIEYGAKGAMEMLQAEEAPPQEADSRFAKLEYWDA